MHVSVLRKEMLELLRVAPGGVYLDGTLGAGGYSESILGQSGPQGIVIGLDLDSEAIDRASARLSPFGEMFLAAHGGFHEAPEILSSLGFSQIDGAVLDLGLSSDQLEDPKRGFSFRRDGPLDMRFDAEGGRTVLDFLSGLSAEKVGAILRDFGEERHWRRIAKNIHEARVKKQIKTTRDLADLVARTARGRRSKIHPATRTFQALRIAVNREMDNLDTALERIPPLLKPGGRLCVVSYHSLEDRRVKIAFRERAKHSDAWSLVTRKPIRPSEEETKSNPRSRSARMRALQAGE